MQFSYNTNKNEKTRNYRIIDVEHNLFTPPLVYICYGALSRECSQFYLHDADKGAEKRKLSKSIVPTWLRTTLNFSLVGKMLWSDI